MFLLSYTLAECHWLALGDITRNRPIKLLVCGHCWRYFHFIPQRDSDENQENSPLILPSRRSQLPWSNWLSSQKCREFSVSFLVWSLGSSGPKFPLISKNCMCTIYEPFMVLHMSLLTISYTSNVFLKLSLYILKVYNTQISSYSVYLYKFPGIFWKHIYLIVALAKGSYGSLSLLFQPCLCQYVSWISDPITVTPTIPRLNQRDASGTFMLFCAFHEMFSAWNIVYLPLFKENSGGFRARVYVSLCICSTLTTCYRPHAHLAPSL